MEDKNKAQVPASQAGTAVPEAAEAKVRCGENAPGGRINILDIATRRDKDEALGEISAALGEVEATSLSELVLGKGLEERITYRAPGGGAPQVVALSKSTAAVCPECGQVSTRLHECHERHPKMFPINGCTPGCGAVVKRWKCTNPLCRKKTFVEELPTLARGRHFFDFAYMLAFSLGIFISATGVETVLGLLGLRISDDTVRRIVSRVRRLEDIDVVHVGVDDVHIAKGRSYYTIIYDALTHRFLALLPDRDGKALEKWLSVHRRILRINRDRASAFAKVITEVLGQIEQVADVWHLFHNLLEHLKEAFYAQFPEKVWVLDLEDGTAVVTEEEPKMVSVPYVPLDSPSLMEVEMDNSPALDSAGNPVEVDTKQHNIVSEEARAAAEKRVARHKQTVEVRAMWSYAGGDEMDRATQLRLRKEIERKTGVKSRAIPGMLKMTDDEVAGILLAHELPARLNPALVDYVNIIYKLLRDRRAPAWVYSYVLTHGYKGTPSPLKTVICNIQWNHFGRKASRWSFDKMALPPHVHEVSRFDAIRYVVTKDRDKMKDTAVAKYYDVLCARYPIIVNMGQIWKDFTDVYASRDPDRIDKFIEKHRFGMATPFCDGLLLDIDAVKNGLKGESNSGYVEGGNRHFLSVKLAAGGNAGMQYLSDKLYAQGIIRKAGGSLDDLYVDYHRVHQFFF